MAISVSQLSWASAMTHADVVVQIVQTEQAEGRSGDLAFLYDELLRRHLAARAARADSNLDILWPGNSLNKIHRPLLEEARTHLGAALPANGVRQERGELPDRIAETLERIASQIDAARAEAQESWESRS